MKKVSPDHGLNASASARLAASIAARSVEAQCCYAILYIHIPWYTTGNFTCHVAPEKSNPVISNFIFIICL